MEEKKAGKRGNKNKRRKENNEGKVSLNPHTIVWEQTNTLSKNVILNIPSLSLFQLFPLLQHSSYSLPSYNSPSFSKLQTSQADLGAREETRERSCMCIDHSPLVREKESNSV